MLDDPADGILQRRQTEKQEQFQLSLLVYAMVNISLSSPTVRYALIHITAVLQVVGRACAALLLVE